MTLRSILAAGFLACAAVAAHAQIIPGLYNTGVDNAGAQLADGASDTHYSLTGTGAPANPYAVANNGAWIINASSLVSKWVSPGTSGDAPVDSGQFTYTLTFNLPSGWDPSGTVITGRWATDNLGTIFVNGQNSGESIPFGYPAFQTWDSFSLSGDFVSGLNTISFVIENGINNGFPSPNPSGLRVEFLTAVPEPATYAMIVGGLALVFVGFRRFRPSHRLC